MQPAPFWYRYIEKSIVCAFFFVVPLIVGLLVPYFLLRESIYRTGMTEETMETADHLRPDDWSPVEFSSVNKWNNAWLVQSSELNFNWIAFWRFFASLDTRLHYWYAKCTRKDWLYFISVHCTSFFAPAVLRSNTRTLKKCKCKKCLPSDHVVNFHWIFHCDSCWNSCIPMP